ncbi:MAG: hypothetical protein ABI318_01385 [Chthoniobacteraceae bacterium]
MRSKVAPHESIVRLLLMLCGIAHASGQTGPSFRSNAPLRLLDATVGTAETSPAGGSAVTPQPGGDQRDLFSPLPQFRPPGNVMPGLPPGSPTMPVTPQNTAWSQTPIRIGGAPAGSSRSRASERPPETPLSLQRHPDRNLISEDGSPAFTWRSTSDASALAQLSIGLQSDTWHTDNLTNVQRRLAIGDVIAELRPILQLDIGSAPVGRTADLLSTEYYLTLRYTPTLHMLADAGTSRGLERVTGEIGRASPVLTSRVRFEYDENIFGARGDNTVEGSSTVTTVSPFIEYSLNAKTAVHIEGTWNRFAPEDVTTRRSEYILETGITCAATAKTTLGAGLEFGHIVFDHAQYGVQNYEQGYASMTWQASPKVRFQTRAGVELRQFDATAPKPARVSPVATAILNWTPGDNTQVNAGFLVRNEPSVSLRGATFQEVRFGMDARQRIAENFYVRGEATIIHRAYDTGTRELETIVRPAFGFHTHTSRLFNSLNVEIYYQFDRVDSNQSGIDRDRNIFGIQSTLYF